MTLHPARARSAHVSASAPRRLRWRWPLRNRLDVPTLITTTLCFLGALPTRISPGLTPVGLLLFILECIVREADATTRYCDCGAERAGFSLRPRWPSIFPPGRVRRRRSSESWGRKSREHENAPTGGLNPPRWLAARVGEGAVGIETSFTVCDSKTTPRECSLSGLVRPLSEEGEGRRGDFLDALTMSACSGSLIPL